METGEERRQLERDLIEATPRDLPISVSGETGRVRSVEERIRDIRAGAGSVGRGSCQQGYSTWGD